MDLGASRFATLGQQCLEPLAVTSGEEDLTAAGTPIHHVIPAAVEVDSQWSSHADDFAHTVWQP
jgi:hypothetical protein